MRCSDSAAQARLVNIVSSLVEATSIVRIKTYSERRYMSAASREATI